MVNPLLTTGRNDDLRWAGLSHKKSGASRFVHRYLSLGRSPFPLRHIAEGVTPRPQGVPLISHLTAYSCQLTAYREFAAPRHPSCSFAAARLTKKECALLGRLSAFCIKAKLGSPMQDFHLQGPAYQGLP